MSQGRQQVNVRVDPRTRAALEAAAAASDRTVSQLVRYAVTDWIADPDRAFPVVAPDGPTVQVRLRWDTADLDAIDMICDETGVTRSMAIRCAILVWMAKVADQQAALLGTPYAGLAALGALGGVG